MEMKFILDYKIIRGLPGDVENQVQELLDRCDGWQPEGKLFIMKLGDYEVLVQKMVRAL